MRKLIFAGLILLAAMVNYNHAGAKGKTCQIGSFRYNYRTVKKGIWITEITPVSDQGTATLNIPSKLDGKKVVKLGSTALDEEIHPNIFGVYADPDVEAYRLLPKKLLEKVKRIKKIKIPSTVQSITPNCFVYMQDGKTINIPKGVTENVADQFTYVKWKKITISEKNKKYKVKDGCMLSKDGKVLYGFAQKKKTMVIPGTVKKIRWYGDYRGCSTIIIPKSVNRIEKNSDYDYVTPNPVTIKIEKGNKRYAVKAGSVYSKATGRLVLGYVNKDGVLDIPPNITQIDRHACLGGNIQKIIIPSSVTKIYNLLMMAYRKKVTFVIQKKKPPKLVEPEYVTGAPERVTIYVPKNCKNNYLKKWKIDPLVKGKIAFAEQ